MGVKYISTINGMEAWKLLTNLADQAETSGGSVADKVQVILTDVEMPEMDGYVLTRRIKEDPRFGKSRSSCTPH